MAKRKLSTDEVEIIPGDKGAEQHTGEGPDARTAGLQARIAELEAQLARQPVDVAPPVEEWPKVLYRRHKVDDKHPMGYEARRFDGPEAITTHGKGWLDADSVDGQALLAGEA